MCLRKIHCNDASWVTWFYEWNPLMIYGTFKIPQNDLLVESVATGFGRLLRRFAFKKQLREVACKHRPACGTWSLFYPWDTSSLAISRFQRLATVPLAHQHPCASCMVKEPTITCRAWNMMKDKDVMMIKPSVENDRAQGSRVLINSDLMFT